MNKEETHKYLADHGIAFEITEHGAVFNMEELKSVELPYPEALCMCFISLLENSRYVRKYVFGQK